MTTATLRFRDIGKLIVATGALGLSLIAIGVCLLILVSLFRAMFLG